MRRQRHPGAAKRVLANRRLYAQQIGRHDFTTPADLVAWLGAVQAQDYGAAKWALGLRLPEGATDAIIERAIAEGAILRTHALRGTWQLVTPKDVRWMLKLVAPRLAARFATRHRQLELDAATFRRSNAALEKALRDGSHLTRAELATALRRARISTAGQRLAHLLAQAEADAVICSGARRWKQSTYALLDHRSPDPPRPLARADALAELARRYFRSRGPATVADFAWWSGLPAAEARVGLESVKSALISDVIDGQIYWRSDEPAARTASAKAYLLPAFEEYLIAYRARDAVLDPRHAERFHGGGLLDPCVILEGTVIGTWRRALGRRSVAIDLHLFEPGLRRPPALAAAAAKYGAFLGLDVVA